MEYYVAENPDELYHYGVKGMKWGVQRYRNPYGGLTREGARRSRQYARKIGRADRSLNRKSGRRAVDAYNETARLMNNGLINKYNREWEKRHGDDVGPEYESKYYAYNDKIMGQVQKKMDYQAIVNNRSFQKAQDFARKYDMESWDDLAKQNKEFINKYMKEASKPIDDSIDW